MAEQKVILLDDSSNTGKNVRTIEVTKTISGTPTTVEMQAVTLSDTGGDDLVVNADGSLNVNLAPSASATLTNQTNTGLQTTFASSNTARKGLIVYNDTPGNLFIAYAATVSSTSFSYKVPAGATWEMPIPVYTGQIEGLGDGSSGALRITEY